MVRDEITDGRRIAQLLSSELTGLARGPLSDVHVVDADPDVSPTPAGATAYAIEQGDGRLGTVAVRPDAAVLDLQRALPPDATVDRSDLSVEADDQRRLVIERGAGVKAAVDVLRAVVAE